MRKIILFKCRACGKMYEKWDSCQGSRRYIQNAHVRSFKTVTCSKQCARKKVRDYHKEYYKNAQGRKYRREYMREYMKTHMRKKREKIKENKDIIV